MRFHPRSMYLLALLLLLPLIWWRWLQKRPADAMRFSSVRLARRQYRGFGARWRFLLPVLRTLALALLVLCLARPEKGNEQTRVYAEGLAIQMVLDASGSMEQPDYVLDRRRCRRIDAVKRVVHDFIDGDETTLHGRPDDLIGVISFARYPDGLAPLTLDHDNVVEIIDTLETVSGPAAQRREQELRHAYGEAQQRNERRRMTAIEAEYTSLREENQTAIGDALALAVERMRDLDRELDADAPAGARRSHRITGKVIILLTDGENNAGDLTPPQAAELAKASKIKIYTIGIGSPMQGGAILGEDQMKQVAETTGGRYFRATDTDSLKRVYEEIDQLEKTKTEQRRYTQYRQLATSAVRLGDAWLPPLLAVVLGLLGLEVVLAVTRLRQLP